MNSNLSKLSDEEKKKKYEGFSSEQYFIENTEQLTNEEQNFDSSPPLIKNVTEYTINFIRKEQTTNNNNNLYSKKLNFGINNYKKYSIGQYNVLYTLLLKDTNYNRFIGINENDNKKIEIKLFIIDVVDQMLLFYSYFLSRIDYVDSENFASKIDENFASKIDENFASKIDEIFAIKIDKFIQFHRNYENTNKGVNPLFNSIDFLYLENYEDENKRRIQQPNKYIKRQLTIDNPKDFNFEYSKNFVNDKINNFKNNITTKTNIDFSNNNNNLRKKVKDSYNKHIPLLKNIFDKLLQNTLSFYSFGKNIDDETNLKDNLKFHVFLSYIANINKYIIYLSILQNSDYKDKMDGIISFIKDPGLPNSGNFVFLLDSMFSVNTSDQVMTNAITRVIEKTSSISVSFSGIGGIAGLFKSVVFQFVASALANKGGKKTRRQQKRMIKVNAKRRNRKSKKIF